MGVLIDRSAVFIIGGLIGRVVGVITKQVMPIGA